MGAPTAAPSAQALRGLSRRPTWIAAGFFALLAFASLWPALIGVKVLSGDAVLYGSAPWSPFTPTGVAGFRNAMLTDVPLVVRPWHQLVRELLRDGVLPLWNPHVLSGIPLFQNPQSGIFTPFNLPMWILPLDYAVGLVAALKLFAAGLGTYLLVRELRLGFLPGLVAGASFAFCSMNVVWLLMEAVPAVTVLLPWMLWLVERLLASGGRVTAIALACVTAAALFGGHPGMQAHVLLVAGSYAVLRTALDGRRRLRERARRLGLALGGLALGLALAGVMLIPELLSSRDTVGVAARKHGGGDLPGLRHMPFDMIRTALFPDWWGRPSAFEAPSSPTHTVNVNYQERTFYAGAVALVLALAGLTSRARLRRQAPFAVLGALGLAIALHAPGVWWLVTHLPGLELVENQRLHVVFELAVAVLAAFGLQALLDRPQDRGRHRAVALGAVVVALVAAATAGASWTDAADAAMHVLAGRDVQDAGALALASIGWFLLFAVGVLVALVAARRWPQRRLAVAGALVVLATADMLHFAHGYNPMGPRDEAILPRTDAIAYLQQHRDEGRVMGIDLALMPDTASRFGLDDVRGYDPPYPTRRYLALWRAAAPEQVSHLPLLVPSLSPEAVQVGGALGARFLVTDPDMPMPRSPHPALRSLRLVYSGIDAAVYRNPRATPRAFVPQAIELVPSFAETRAALVERRFDAGRTAVVEGDQSGARSLRSVGDVRGRAAISKQENARVTLTATLDRPGIVVLADQLLDGWSVHVDGKPATPLHVNAVLRGVAVDAGRHEIEWTYRVPGLRAGAALSGAALALLIAAAAWPRIRRLRARGARR